MATPSQAGVARTLDMRRLCEHVHTFASVGPPGYRPHPGGPGSRVSCGLSPFSGLLPIHCHGFMRGALPPRTWYQRPREFPASRCVAPVMRTRLLGQKRAWDFQNFHPCGNFSGTSSLKFRGTKGSIGHTFMVCIHTENQNQGDFYPFILLEISVLNESPLGHLRYLLTDVPPQPNSPPDNVIGPGRTAKVLKSRKRAFTPSPASPNK